MATTSAKKPIAKTRTTNTRSKASAAKSGTKTATRKTTATTTAATTKATAAKRTPPADARERGPHGFAIGTDAAIIAESLIEGGLSRDECNKRATERIGKSSGLTTRGGKPKYIPSMAATIINDLVNSGKYTVESSYRLVPVNGTAKDSGVKKVGVTKKAPAKRTPAKKTTAGTRSRKPAAKK